jgi:hypothetical protein|tara:strand:- start:1918 stop:2523 length:606 start_codon:yes stop_codon:yes gene_type:complete
MKPTLKRFLTLLCGEYSNQQQAFDNPPLFAHIILRYRPIEHLQPGSILLEQTYAVDPENPYRLRMIRAEELDTGAIKLWNHIFHKPDQFSKATLDLSLRKQIKESDLIPLDQSHYQVTEQEDGYHGEIEPGSVCIVNRDGKDTILVSSFHLQGDRLSTLDRGQDPLTNERCWGSIAGEFRFKRLETWEATWNQHPQAECDK